MAAPPLTFGKSALICGLTALICLILNAAPAAARPWWLPGTAEVGTDFLPPDVAFRVGAHVDGNVIRIRWAIAEVYYLYRHRIGVQAESPDLEVSAPSLPAGVLKIDANLGPQEVYEHGVEAVVAFSRFDAGAHPMQIKVTYQGCAEAGLCYLPITKVLSPRSALGAESGAASGAASRAASGAARAWEGIAIGAGVGGFLLAGWLLRKGRRLESLGL